MAINIIGGCLVGGGASLESGELLYNRNSANQGSDSYKFTEDYSLVIMAINTGDGNNYIQLSMSYSGDGTVLYNAHTSYSHDTHQWLGEMVVSNVKAGDTVSSYARWQRIVHIIGIK